MHDQKRLTCLAGLAGLLCFAMVSTADARLIRRGGAGSAVAPAILGDRTYLVTQNLGLDVGDTVAAADVANTFSFSFGADGEPFQVNQNWGGACSESRQIPGEPVGIGYQCEFQLALDESLIWSGHIVGLPDPATITATTVEPVLTYEWILEAGTSVFSFDQTSPEAFLGDLLPFIPEDPDGFEEGCFARYKDYTEGFCQLVNFDSGTLLGADLAAAAAGGDVSLSLEATYTAPGGYEFVNVLFDDTDPAIFGTVQAPFFTVSDDGAQIQARSRALPITFVPTPPSVLLLLAGAGAVVTARRRRRGAPAP